MFTLTNQPASVKCWNQADVLQTGKTANCLGRQGFLQSRHLAMKTLLAASQNEGVFLLACASLRATSARASSWSDLRLRHD